MKIDLERVKQLTLEKVERQGRISAFPMKRTLMIAALVAISSALFLGAAKLFDWKVMVDGKIQQGDYGDSILAGDGFAAMSPQKEDPAGASVTEPFYPDQTPDRMPEPGELSLFAYRSEDGDTVIWTDDIAGEETADLERLKQLAGHAQAEIHWPEKIGADYRVLDAYIRYYTQKEQMGRSRLLYSSFGQWKNQQVFLLPDGYETCIELMNLELETPDGKAFHFVSHLAATDAQIYGNGGSSVIEQLDMDGYENVVFVSDDGWNQLYAWRKIPAIESVDPLAFGEKQRPEGNILDVPAREDVVYQWQQYCFHSESLTKEELVGLLGSIDLTQ